MLSIIQLSIRKSSYKGWNIEFKTRVFIVHQISKCMTEQLLSILITCQHLIHLALVFLISPIYIRFFGLWLSTLISWSYRYKEFQKQHDIFWCTIFAGFSVFIENCRWWMNRISNVLVQKVVVSWKIFHPTVTYYSYSQPISLWSFSVMPSIYKWRYSNYQL